MTEESHHVHGFSLVELLVVIAVMGLLLSLLVPAVGRAKDHGKLITCRANLHNLSLSCRAYALEHDTFLPTDTSIDNHHLKLIGMLSEGGYVEGMGSFFCPSEKREDLCFSMDNIEAGNISYFYYSFTDRPTNRYFSNFLRKSLDWPRVLKDTMPGDTWVISDSWFSNMPTAHRFYKKGVNYSVLDGSVQMVTKSPRQKFR